MSSSSDEVEIIELSDDNQEDDENDVIVINYNEKDASVDTITNICIVIKDEESPLIIPSNSKSANLKDPITEIINLDSCSAVSDKKNTNSNEIRQKSTSNRKRRVGGGCKGNSDKNTKNIDGGIQECNKVLKVSTIMENSNNLLSSPVLEKDSNISNNEYLNNIDEQIANESTNHIAPPTTVNIEKRLNNYDFSKLKWLKPLKSISSPPHLQIVIIDRSHQNWRITNDKWLMIEKRLLEALNVEMLRTNDASIGLFDGAKWLRGIKIVGCHNKNAFNFIAKFILNLDKLWHGAKLDVFPITHISRHIVKVYIPPPTLDTQVILSLIRLQNASLCCEDWKVLRERERGNGGGGGGVDIWFSINDECFTDLCRLRGQIKYGINRIFFKPSD